MTNEYSVIKAVLLNSFSKIAVTVDVSSNVTGCGIGDIEALLIIATDWRIEETPGAMSDERWMSSVYLLGGKVLKKTTLAVKKYVTFW